MLHKKGALCCLFLIAFFNTNSVEAFVCLPDFCASVSCLAVKCKSNEILKLGGACNCCNQCYTILGINETCGSPLQGIIQGSPPPTVECGEGLICNKGICQKISSLS